jgi:hypothetical protein
MEKATIDIVLANGKKAGETMKELQQNISEMRVE